jgi:hypothetical protein
VYRGAYVLKAYRLKQLNAYNNLALSLSRVQQWTVTFLENVTLLYMTLRRRTRKTQRPAVLFSSGAACVPRFFGDETPILCNVNGRLVMQPAVVRWHCFKQLAGCRRSCVIPGVNVAVKQLHDVQAPPKINSWPATTVLRRIIVCGSAVLFCHITRPSR